MNIRAATLNEVSTIFSFIQKKSEFDRNIGAYSGIIQVTEDKIRQTLFGKVPFAYVLFAEKLDLEKLGSEELDLDNFKNTIGFALYGFRYSSFVGQPSIWLDDLYVDEEMRSQGAGNALMSYLVGVGKGNDCTHIAWTADARNIRGLSFYKGLGAEIIETKGNRCFLKWVL
ncbi:MAG: GNAT family N-acetyltransferase [Mastigocoleus sp.]